MNIGFEATSSSDPTDPGTTPDRLLDAAEQREAEQAFKDEWATLQEETENLDSIDPGERRMRELFMDFESLRTLSNHELVTKFFEFFRNTFTGDPYDESVPDEGWREHYDQCRRRAEKFSKSGEANMYSSPLLDSGKVFEDLARSLHVVRIYGENSEGLTVPYAIPVWIIGRDVRDDETTEYLAVSLDTVVSPKDYGTGKPEWLAVEHESADGSLRRAHKALDEIEYEREYEQGGLAPQLKQQLRFGFEVFSFSAADELPGLAEQLYADTESLKNLSRKEEGKPRQYDIRPREMARQVDEAIPVASGVGAAELTDEAMYRMGVLAHLKGFAEYRNLTARLAEITELGTQRRHVRELVYQKRKFPELDGSSIPEELTLPPDWREQQP